MQISDDALVIREKRLEEKDRLLTLLTKNHGVITAYAKGATSLKGGMVSSTELLCYSHFQLFTKSERAYVDKAESNTVFFGLRKDIEKLSLASYFCQICCELIHQHDNCEYYQRLMLNCLHYLEKDKMPPQLIKCIFELRCLTIAGYMPDLVACTACGDMGSRIFFSPIGGVIFCEKCKPQLINNYMEISASALSAMRHIIYSDFEKLFAFSISQQSVDELSGICRAYTIAQVEKLLPALTFYESFVIPR